MIIISDTTPLRYLIEIEKAQLLATLFGKIIVPPAVLNDLQGAKTPQKVKDWAAQPPAWLEIRQANAALYSPQKKIGDGEREAFLLALELNADAVLVDDKGALVEAKRLGLKAIRTFAILESAAAAKLIDLAQTVAELRNTSFRFPPAKEVEAMLERDQQRQAALNNTPQENG